jgi:hypothetical protein
VKNRIKSFYTEHKSDILFTAGVVGVSAAYIAFVIYTMKIDAESQEQLMAFTIEQNKLGKTVLQLADGSYLAVKMD